MLIRSQSKEKLFNLNNMTRLYLFKAMFESEKPYGIRINFVNEEWDLGWYSTKEKAIKVLDMIQNCYEISLYCDYEFDISAQAQRPYIFANNYAFQMPLDKDVII